MTQLARSRLLILGLVLTAGVVAWLSSEAHRTAEETASRQIASAQRLMNARLEMEAALQGFLIAPRENSLEPYIAGRADFRLAESEARRVSAEAGGIPLINRQKVLTLRWIRSARRAITRRRAGGPVSIGGVRLRKRSMERFRSANGAYFVWALERRDERRENADKTLLGGMLGLAALALLGSLLLIDRPQKRFRSAAMRRAEFADTLQYASGEAEAQTLLNQRIEQLAPGTDAAVLVRDDSEERLTVPAGLKPESPLNEVLSDAKPSDCLAIRRGRQHRRGSGEEHLVECDLCGKVAGRSVCTPLLVGGEVTGVSLATGADVDDDALSEISSAVELAAPVLANLRNLSAAQTRAVTDALTGLSNSRAANETLARMAAYSIRSNTPLAAIVADIDRFKRINDRLGHQAGDRVLAAIAGRLRDTLRDSDFVARYGGEEFLVLLQGTDRADGEIVAEKLRDAITHIQLPGVSERLTLSLGVAAMPTDAVDGDGLVRAADRALYAAKAAGRNQVALAEELPGGSEPIGGQGSSGGAAAGDDPFGADPPGAGPLGDDPFGGDSPGAGPSHGDETRAPARE